METPLWKTLIAPLIVSIVGGIVVELVRRKFKGRKDSTNEPEKLNTTRRMDFSEFAVNSGEHMADILLLVGNIVIFAIILFIIGLTLYGLYMLVAGFMGG